MQKDITVALDVIELFRNQTKHHGTVKLQSIKVALPEGCDPDEISNWIEEHYPEYKAHSKPNNNAPMLAIGYR